MSIHIIGTGLSDGATLTVGAQELLDKAQLIVGASRLVEPYKDREGVAIVEQINSEAIAQLCSESAGQDVCVLMSGDTGFYSGATKLYGLLRDRGIDAVVVPGISSVQALAARLGQPWQDWHLVSAHGRDCDPVAQVRDNRFTFFLTGGDWHPGKLCYNYNG